MTHSVFITIGRTFEIPDYDGTLTPADFVKTQLGRIVQAYRFDTVYDSMTGYPVGFIGVNEMQVMLNQIWAGELEPDMTRVLTAKISPDMADFIEIIESGVEQLRIRMIATMRPTPALAFQRDRLALERVRKTDPQRVLSYLLIRLFCDNPQAQGEDGLAGIMLRHEMAINIGRHARTIKDSWQMWAASRQLIELDARFNVTQIKMVGRREEEFDGLRVMLIDYSDGKHSESEIDFMFGMIANFASKLIAQEENLTRNEDRGNRAMQPAFVELTHAEVIAKITREAEEIGLDRQAKAAHRELTAARKKGKIHIDMSMLSGLTINDLLSTPLGSKG